VKRVFLPSAIDELFRLMEQEPEALLFAGGTDLIVKARHGIIDPPSLICLERIEALRVIDDRGSEVFIGAAATHSSIIEHALISREFPLLTRALAQLGSPPIRHMGTIGGNIVTASPAGDSLPALHVLDALVEIACGEARRRMRLAEFITGPGETCLGKGEILAGVLLRKEPSWTIQHFEKVGKRKALAVAVASLAAALRISESGIIEGARLAWGSLGPRVITSRKTEEAMEGRFLSLETLRRAATCAQEEVSPIDDMRAGASYRRRLAGSLVLRLTQYAAAE
jgi:CO/xanthine dehydrogenase FAD-binding subunit